MSLVHQVKKVRAILRHLLIGHLTDEHRDLERKLEQLALSIGRHEARTVCNAKYTNIQAAEFKVFSQFGEDGIIQYLIHTIPIPNRTFVELGVGSYEESNTRFLLMHDNWKGLIVDAGTEHVEYLNSEKGKYLLYAHELTAVSAFLTTNTVNKLLRDAKVTGDIGLLSIDIDGMDYWIFESISAISPRIVIIEYNSTFGPKATVTVPYAKAFNRTRAHYSNLYFGASLQALCILAKKKGYVFVGSNSAGNNAFFVRKDVAHNLPTMTAQKGYVRSLYRESKDVKGRLTYLGDHRVRLKEMQDMDVLDIRTGKLRKVKTLMED